MAIGYPIFNASSQLLSDNSGTLPQMEGLLDYFQPMTFTTVVKTVVAFKVVETPTNVSFMGCWQPFSARQLQIKPEGQRAWQWVDVFSQINLGLSPDDVITYKSVQYRVMSVGDYSMYNYFQYTIIRDYSGSGP